MRAQYPSFFAHILKIMLLSCVFSLTACSVVATPREGPRPSQWATPVAGLLGLPNLNRVNAHFYRSAQPTQAGFALLDKHEPLVAGDLPIKTVLSLRAFHDDASQYQQKTSLVLIPIQFNTWHAEREDVVKFLRIINTPNLQPVLLHCQHGSDRTGTMTAIYRIAEQGWSKDEAINEMVEGGYGFHPMWKNLIAFINQLDIDAVKKEAAAQGDWK